MFDRFGVRSEEDNKSRKVRGFRLSIAGAGKRR